MHAVRPARNSRTRVSRGLSREKFSSPGVTPAKPLRVAPASSENATLGYPAVSDSFRRRWAHRRTAAFAKVESAATQPARALIPAAKGSHADGNVD
jgi:hypothetical protein